MLQTQTGDEHGGEQEHSLEVHDKKFELADPHSDTLKHLVKSWREHSEEHLHNMLRGAEHTSDLKGMHIGNGVFVKHHSDGTYSLSHHHQ